MFWCCYALNICIFHQHRQRVSAPASRPDGVMDKSLQCIALRQRWKRQLQLCLGFLKCCRNVPKTGFDWSLLSILRSAAREDEVWKSQSWICEAKALTWSWNYKTCCNTSLFLVTILQTWSLRTWDWKVKNAITSDNIWLPKSEKRQHTDEICVSWRNFEPLQEIVVSRENALSWELKSESEIKSVSQNRVSPPMQRHCDWCWEKKIILDENIQRWASFMPEKRTHDRGSRSQTDS